MLVMLKLVSLSSVWYSTEILGKGTSSVTMLLYIPLTKAHCWTIKLGVKYS